MSRRKNKVPDALSTEFPEFQETEFESVVFCTVCESNISIANKGKSDIVQHQNTQKHKGKLKDASTSKKMDKMFVKVNTPLELKVLTAETVLTYHVVKHNQSYLSCDCTSKLLPKIFPDSGVAAKIACARTKTEAIVNNVLAPHSVNVAIEELRSLPSPFIGVSTDGSNHGATKMFPVLIQFFHPTKGIRQCLIAFESVENETALRITELLTTTLERRNLMGNCVAFSGDNCNTNFGGLRRAGKENVFYHLSKSTKHQLVGIGCPAHLLHNSARHGLDRLDIDIETLVYKIYTYFSIYTVRTEELKSFCTFVDTEYKRVLKHTKTRWLSLMPTVERIIQLYPALKSYFQSIENPPKLLETFFLNDDIECYLWFVHSVMGMFHSNIERLEAQDSSIIETISTLKNVRRQLMERKEQQFLPIQVKKILRNSSQPDQADKTKKMFLNVYNDCLEYIEKWASHFKELEVFNWMALDKIPKWDDVEESVEFLRSKDIDINESEMFDQITLLASFVESKLDDQDFRKQHAVHKWTSFFQAVTNKPSLELLKLCCYFFAIPSNNASVERLFSLMNIIWTDSRNKLLPESVQSLLMVKFNYNFTCQEFLNVIQNDNKLLKEVRSSNKYA